jgi:hypothetical protein
MEKQTRVKFGVRVFLTQIPLAGSKEHMEIAVSAGKLNVRCAKSRVIPTLILEVVAAGSLLLCLNIRRIN